MKRLSILLLGAALTACSEAPKPYVLTGRIAHAGVDDLLLIGEHVNQMDTVRLAEDGSFTYSHTFDEPAFGFAYVADKAFYSLIFINGTSSHLEANIANPVEYRISGDLEAAHEFQQAATRQLGELGEQEFETFAGMQSTYAAVRDSLEQTLDKISPREFHALELAGIEETLRSNLTEYYQTLRSRGAALDSDPDYNRYMEEMELTEENAVTYLYWKEICAGREASPSFQTMIQTADRKIADPKLKERTVLSLMSDCFSAGGADMEAAYEAARPLVADEKAAKWLTETYEANKNLIPGAPALDCELEDPRGTKLHLSDLYGKTLYMDVWATWCGPCCEEIPYLEKLVESYRGDSRIEFVSITVDKDRDAWLKKLAADKPRWRQLRNPDFTSLYGISGIPCFLMISPEGKIITVHAPRPSDPEIRTFIDQTLAR